METMLEHSVRLDAAQNAAAAANETLKLSNMDEVACDWMKNNKPTWELWLPRCQAGHYNAMAAASAAAGSSAEGPPPPSPPPLPPLTGKVVPPHHHTHPFIFFSFFFFFFLYPRVKAAQPRYITRRGWFNRLGSGSDIVDARVEIESNRRRVDAL